MECVAGVPGARDAASRDAQRGPFPSRHPAPAHHGGAGAQSRARKWVSVTARAASPSVTTPMSPSSISSAAGHSIADGVVSSAGYSIYEGWEFQGQVVHTLVRGRAVFRDNAVWLIARAGAVISAARN